MSGSVSKWRRGGSRQPVEVSVPVRLHAGEFEARAFNRVQTCGTAGHGPALSRVHGIVSIAALVAGNVTRYLPPDGFTEARRGEPVSSPVSVCNPKL